MNELISYFKLLYTKTGVSNHLAKEAKLAKEMKNVHGRYENSNYVRDDDENIVFEDFARLRN